MVDDEKDDKTEKAAIVLGKLGGIARAAKLSPERRSEIAKIAAEKRWDKIKNPA